MVKKLNLKEKNPIKICFRIYRPFFAYDKGQNKHRNLGKHLKQNMCAKTLIFSANNKNSEHLDVLWCTFCIQHSRGFQKFIFAFTKGGKSAIPKQISIDFNFLSKFYFLYQNESINFYSVDC
jgi:hypothetical protein